MRQPGIALVAALAAFGGAGPGASATEGTRADPCAGASTQMEITECHGREYQKADRRLNQAYAPLLAALDAEHQEKLKAAERAWVAFRDADCDLEASRALHGSMEPTLLAMCKTTMTEERIRALAVVKDSLADYLR